MIANDCEDEIIIATASRLGERRLITRRQGNPSFARLIAHYRIFALLSCRRLSLIYLRINPARETLQRIPYTRSINFS